MAAIASGPHPLADATVRRALTSRDRGSTGSYRQASSSPVWTTQPSAQRWGETPAPDMQT